MVETMSNKEYGKLTLDQFKCLVKKLPEVRGQMKELPGLLRSTSAAKLEEILDEDFHWSEIYEISLVEQLALMAVVLGDAQRIVQIGQAADPQQAVLEWMDEDIDEDNWTGGFEGLFGKKYLFMFVTALQRNILSIMIYHQSLAAFVEDVRSGSKTADESFFKAVRVDRSILTCPTFADRLARAELTDDKGFFLHLRSALKGLSNKHWESYRDLRYSMAILRELGFDQLSDAQLEDLLVHKLKLYPNAPGARKNLRKQFTEAKKISTTPK